MKTSTRFMNIKFSKKIIVILLLLLSIVSVMHAETKNNYYIYAGADADLATWKEYLTTGGITGDSEQHGDDDYFYWQSIHGRGWSSNGGLHIISQTYDSVYNTNNLDMPETGPLRGSPGFVTTRHFWQHSPHGGSTTGYTSDEGTESSSDCFYTGCGFVQ